MPLVSRLIEGKFEIQIAHAVGRCWDSFAEGALLHGLYGVSTIGRD